MGVAFHNGLRWVLGRRTWVLVTVFILFDLLAVWLYRLYQQDVLSSRFFHIARDRGFCEMVGYLKVGLILAILWICRKVQPSRLLGAWWLLFLFILLDDALGIHEEVGKWLLTIVEIPALLGDRPQDMAEAIAFALFEGGLLLHVGWWFLRDSWPLQRFSIQLGLAMAPLFFFGMVLDQTYYAMLETGGEMGSMTLLMAFVHWTYRRRGPGLGRPGVQDDAEL